MKYPSMEKITAALFRLTQWRNGNFFDLPDFMSIWLSVPGWCMMQSTGGVQISNKSFISSQIDRTIPSVLLFMHLSILIENE